MQHSQTASATTFEVLDFRFRCSPALWVFISKAVASLRKAALILLTFLVGLLCGEADLGVILKYLSH